MKELKIIVITAILFFCFCNVLRAEEWMQFTNGNEITSLAEEGEYLWVGTTAGLVKLNKETGDCIFYHSNNSELPNNYINCIEIDKYNNIWIGTGEGACHFQ